MLICIRAWPVSLGYPSTGFSHPASSWTGREPSSSLTSRAPAVSRGGVPLYPVHAFYATRERSFCQSLETGIHSSIRQVTFPRFGVVGHWGIYSTEGGKEG